MEPKINICKTLPCPYYKYNRRLGCGRFPNSYQCPMYEHADRSIQHSSLAIFSQPAELPLWELNLKKWLQNDRRYAEDTALGDIKPIT